MNLNSDASQGPAAVLDASHNAETKPPVAADLALRLRPDSERSGKKWCKKNETLSLHNQDTSWKHKEKSNIPKNGNSDDPQISRRQATQ